MSVAAELALEPISESEAQLVLELEKAGLITTTALLLDDPDFSYERFEALGAFFGRIRKSSAWWLGDWLNFGERTYDDRFAQAAAATGLSEETLQRYMRVSAAIPADMRRESLPYGVHSMLKSKSLPEAAYWLDRAEAGGWGEAELREHMRAEKAEANPPLPGAESFDLRDVALAILRDARPAAHEYATFIPEQFYLVPNETIARLRAALGEE